MYNQAIVKSVVLTNKESSSSDFLCLIKINLVFPIVNMKKDYVCFSLQIFTLSMEPLELEAGKSLLSAITSETESGRAMVICRHITLTLAPFTLKT